MYQILINVYYVKKASKYLPVTDSLPFNPAINMVYNKSFKSSTT